MAYPVLGDFIPDVRKNIGGRTDQDDNISKWLRDAYREIAGGYPLETLETSDQDVAVPGIDTYSYPENCRALKSITLVDSAVTGATPIQPKKKNLQVVRRYPALPSGTPAVWAPFGLEYIIRPAPSRAFTIFLDFWKKIDLAANEAVIATINSTEVELPDDWFEILTQSATEKAHRDLQESDKAMAIHSQLFGDPNSVRKTPGVIKERLTRNAAENVLSDYGMRPRMRRFTSGR